MCTRCERVKLFNDTILCYPYAKGYYNDIRWLIYDFESDVEIFNQIKLSMLLLY